MSLGRRLINTGAAAAAACTTDTADVFGDGNGIALYNLDYDASDASGNYDGTPTNVDFGVGGQINYGARFNGSTSYIESGISTDILNSDYTISFWGKSTSSTGLFLNTSDGVSTPFVRLDFTLNGDLYFYHRNSSGTAYLNSSIVSGMDDGNWHHVVITKDNTSVKAYKDGSLEGTITSTSGTYSNSTTFQFGRNNYNTNGAYNFNGDIDQVRIFNRALDETTDGEISALYAEEACVYTATTTDNYYPLADGSSDAVAYYKLDNSAEDSVSTNDGTETDIEYRFGRYGQAAVFNGSSSKIVTTLNANGFSQIAISCWIKTDLSSGTGSGHIVSANDGTNWCFLSISKSTGIVQFSASNGGSNIFSATHTGAINDGNWHHIIGNYNGTNATLYIDGNGYTPVSATASLSVNIAFGIGYRNTAASSGTYYDGSIDQVRIFSTALTSDQVTELYNEKPETDTSTFKTVLYEGTGSTQYISNVGFNLDVDNGGDGGLVWIKARDTANSHALYDSVRGATNQLSSDLTAAEASYSTVLSSFDANGFFVETSSIVNTNNDDYVAWVWKAGGDAVSNTVGTATNVQVSNNDKGFSIVTMDADTGVRTVGHGLTVDGVDTAPELIIWKSLTSSTNYWQVLAQAANGGNGHLGRLALQRTDAFLTVSSVWNNTQPTSTVFTLGTSCPDKGVAYCFASVSGVSKIGSYTGSGSATEKPISTGFEPSFVMIKKTSNTGDWFMHDNKRLGTHGYSDKYLKANASSAEIDSSDNDLLEFTDTGFTLRTTFGDYNQLDGEYIYMAFK